MNTVEHKIMVDLIGEVMQLRFICGCLTSEYQKDFPKMVPYYKLDAQNKKWYEDFAKKILSDVEVTGQEVAPVEIREVKTEELPVIQNNSVLGQDIAFYSENTTKLDEKQAISA